MALTDISMCIALLLKRVTTAHHYYHSSILLSLSFSANVADHFANTLTHES